MKVSSAVYADYMGMPIVATLWKEIAVHVTARRKDSLTLDIDICHNSRMDILCRFIVLTSIGHFSLGSLQQARNALIVSVADHASQAILSIIFEPLIKVEADPFDKLVVD